MTPEEIAMSTEPAMAPFAEMVRRHGIKRSYACILNNVGAMLYENKQFSAALGFFEESIEFRTAMRTDAEPLVACPRNENGDTAATKLSDLQLLCIRSEEVWRYYVKLRSDDCMMSDPDFEDGRSIVLTTQSSLSGDSEVIGTGKEDPCRIGMFQRSESSDEGPLVSHVPIRICSDVMGDCAYESAVTLYNMGLIALHRKDEAKAEQLFEMALSLAPADRYDIIAPALNSLGRLYYMQGKFVDALDAFAEAVELGREAVEDTPLPVPKELHTGGHLLLGCKSSFSSVSRMYSGNIGGSLLKDVANAKKSIQRLKLDDLDEILFRIHYAFATSIANIARVHYREGEIQDALQCCNELMSLYGRLYAPTHYHVRVTIYNMGRLYEMLSEHKKAYECYQAFACWARNTFGNQHAHLATALYDVAMIKYRTKSWKDALPLFLKVLSIRETALGPHHEDMAEVLYNTGIVFHDMEEFRDAQHLYERALKIQVKCYSKNHPDIVRTLCNMGRVHHVQGHLEEALSCIMKVTVSVKESSLERNRQFLASMLSHLGNIHLEMGNVCAAMQSFQESVALCGDVSNVCISQVQFQGFNRELCAAATA